MAGLRKDDIPLSPGVYAVYRGDKRMYVGKAKCLQDRVWGNHSGRGVGMGSSALRRNVAEHLGVAKAKDIKDDPHRITPEQAKRVRDWLDGCDIAWRECADHAAAKDLETAMKAEHKPPLTKV
ncbi:MAG TPA: hypothetical protein VHT27_04505 [Solirubrobacteraceae bacterium]|nr:hypothetical protein [Solirubrobacteraceae bacterium]